MQFRQKLIVLAIAPLVAALCFIALFVRQQAVTLAHQQHAALQQAYLAGKQAELQHDVERAAHAIAHQSAPKLGYVVVVPAWGWVLGSGVYLNDVQAALAAVDARQARSSVAAMWWIAGVAVAAMLATLAIGGAVIVLNLGASRVADAKLKALAQRVVDSQEQERARLSRDLHDGISQNLVSIKLMIEAGLVGLGGGRAQQAAARADIAHASSELNNVLGEVRRISHGLRPALLDDLGLAAALDSLAQEYTRHSKAPVAFLAFGQPEGLPDAIGTVLFRIAQEALTNIERHAGARRIDMSLGTRGGRVLLTIADDGAGFDAKSVATHPRRGIGLRNMAERMDAIGGLLAIASSPAGTTVRASVALEAVT